MIVVTGAAGFIGSCLVAKLNELGKTDLIVVDHYDSLEDPKHANLKGKKFFRYLDKAEFLQLILKDAIAGPIECIFHIGACSSTTLQDAEYFRTNNFEYSCHIAQFCLKKNAHLIYASSAATYGDGSLGYDDSEAQLTQLKPLNLYGESKQRFDEWVLNRGLFKKFVGLKFFNVFGPNEYHKADMRSVVARAYQKVAAQGRMALFKSYHPDYADGEQKRDFIYVKDVVDILIFFYQNPSKTGLFNVGTGKAQSWNELAEALFKAVRKKTTIDYIPMPDVLKERYQYFTRANIQKLRQAGYSKSFTPLADAVRDYCGYLKDHRYL